MKKIASNSEEKLKELMIYVASKCSEDPRFGLTKLAKIICFSDLLHYANFGESITGQSYIKEQQGPLAKDFYKVKNKLVEDKEVVEKKIPVINHSRTLLVTTRDPKFDLFTAQQISFVDDVIKAFEKVNNGGASHFSHDYLAGWQDLNFGEEIPYQTIFMPTNYHPTESDKTYSAQLIKKYGWDKIYGWVTN